MCFSERQSLINFIVLVSYGLYLHINNDSVSNIWRLTLILYFLSMKDLIQYLLYKFDDNEKRKNILSILSWIHICFQPLIVNIFFSYFSKSNYNNYWNNIFILLFIFGIYQLTNIDAFNILNRQYCKNKSSDLCSDTNSSYMGKYHIGYKFHTVHGYSILFLFLFIIPALFTNCYMLSLCWGLFIYIILWIFNNVRDSEKAAIWCLMSIIFFIPVTYFRDYFK